MKKLTYMLDCSRDAVASVPAIKKLIKTLSSLGYDRLSLYCEDTYEVKEEPFFGFMRGRFSIAELQEIENECHKNGMTFILSFQTLAHLRTLYHWKEYYSSVIDCNDVLLVGSERLYRLIENIFKTLLRLTSREVNIGMDESFMLGRGKYRNLHGNEPREKIFYEHLSRVLQIAKKYGFKVNMWHDFALEKGEYRDKSIELVKQYNANLILWYYGGWGELAPQAKALQETIDVIKEAKVSYSYAGTAFKFLGLAPHNKLSLDLAKTFNPIIEKEQIEDIWLTAWGDTGGENPSSSVLPVIAYYSYLYKTGKDCDFEQYFAKKIGDLQSFMCLDLPNRISQDENAVNTSSKYFLYSDLFLGYMDNTILPGTKKIYNQSLAKLKKARQKAGEYAYLFDTKIALIGALKEKFNLGYQIRTAYKANDMEMLSICQKQINRVKKSVAKFYSAFQTEWMIENKSVGFEVHQNRLGALLFRLGQCAQTLADYLDGKIAKIEELEYDLLPEYDKCDTNISLNWGELTTMGVMIEYNSFV